MKKRITLGMAAGLAASALLLTGLTGCGEGEGAGGTSTPRDTSGDTPKQAPGSGLGAPEAVEGDNPPPPPPGDG